MHRADECIPSETFFNLVLGEFNYENLEDTNILALTQTDRMHCDTLTYDENRKGVIRGSPFGILAEKSDDIRD